MSTTRTTRCGLSVAAACLLVCASAGAVTVLPTDAHIQYHGRWNFSTPSIPWVYWQGTSLVVAFDGTGVSADLRTSRTEEFRVIVDGVAQTNRLSVTRRQQVNLVSDLDPGIHTLQLMKETVNGNRTYFHGLDVTGSGLVEPPPRPSLRIEFFGDSNMAGESNYSEKNSGGMGTYYAFPAMVTRMLGAEMHLAALGGATLDDIRSYIFSEHLSTFDPAYRSGFDPHLIIVNAGANDLGAGKTTIKNRYRDVIGDLRSVYGEDPHIVLFNAYGWDVNEPAEYIQEVADELGGNLSACAYSWLWEQWHGSQWDHSGEAHQLVDHLASVNPAWVPVAPNDVVDGFGRNFDVANGSFEHQAPFGGFGWRYRLDGVERVQDPGGAAHGAYYIRLEEGEKVHQPIDATGDALPGGTDTGQVYYVSMMIRGTTTAAVAQVSADFEGQQLYSRAQKVTRQLTVTPAWQRYTTTFTAPTGSWKTFLILGADVGTVDVDHVRMSNRPEIDGEFVAPSTLRLRWQSAPGHMYQFQTSEAPDVWNTLKTVAGDGSVLVEDAEMSVGPSMHYRLRAHGGP